MTVGLGADDAYWLSRINRIERFKFVPIGEFEQADNPELCKPGEFVASAMAAIAKMHEKPAGIAGFDDYPASLLALAIAGRAGLPGPSLVSALLCSHKAWSRLVQRHVVPRSVPNFQIIDPWRPHRPADLLLPFPFWLKPVKSSMSYLAYRVNSIIEFERVCAAARENLPRYVAAFDELIAMSRLTPPPGGSGVSGSWLIAEELLGGRQCTLEGFVRGGTVTVLAIVDSVRLPNRVSFKRFDYPSRASATESRQMTKIAETVMRNVGFDGGLFNIEFFLDRRRSAPMIIEINPRFSPQYSDLYHKVDGVLSHQYVIELAAGLAPSVEKGKGSHKIAASCVLRVPDDRIVRRVPSETEITRLKDAIPDTHVYLTARPGDRLSELVQDTLTYRYGLVHLGAANRTELRKRLIHAMKMLPYDLVSLSS
ncbi:MAG: ATP-grasp domain-containing protein [Dongiaceae bacterium]